MQGVGRTLQSDVQVTIPQDAREAAREASLRRLAASDSQASSAGNVAVTLQQVDRIRSAKKALDRELDSIQDYRHYSPAQIMGCVSLLLEIAQKATEHVRNGEGEVRREYETLRWGFSRFIFL